MLVLIDEGNQLDEGGAPKNVKNGSKMSEFPHCAFFTMRQYFSIFQILREIKVGG